MQPHAEVNIFSNRCYCKVDLHSATILLFLESIFQWMYIFFTIIIQFYMCKSSLNEGKKNHTWCSLKRENHILSHIQYMILKTKTRGRKCWARLSINCRGHQYIFVDIYIEKLFWGKTYILSTHTHTYCDCVYIGYNRAKGPP